MSRNDLFEEDLQGFAALPATNYGDWITRNQNMITTGASGTEKLALPAHWDMPQCTTRNRRDMSAHLAWRRNSILRGCDSSLSKLRTKLTRAC
ncbi:hypothetical protein [Paracoccus saliphilus]|uniref:hypothetical protein n=1 Tax=Paracoccus saliphilus TaxID=405559 RepID=UPI002350A6D7|nr:hypothetical protein [Paracoccus saliphilus]